MLFYPPETLKPPPRKKNTLDSSKFEIPHFTPLKIKSLDVPAIEINIFLWQNKNRYII